MNNTNEVEDAPPNLRNVPNCWLSTAHVAAELISIKKVLDSGNTALAHVRVHDLYAKVLSAVADGCSRTKARAIARTALDAEKLLFEVEAS